MFNNILLPSDYQKFKAHRSGNIPPWEFLEGSEIEEVTAAIKSAHPWYENILPFAMRMDSEDFAFFEQTKDDKIIIKVLHCGTSREDELDGEYSSFSDWLLDAAKAAKYFLQV
jgi:hypothetical protein